MKGKEVGGSFDYFHQLVVRYSSQYYCCLPVLPPQSRKEKVTTGGKLLLALILLAQIKNMDISNLFWNSHHYSFQYHDENARGKKAFWPLKKKKTHRRNKMNEHLCILKPEFHSTRLESKSKTSFSQNICSLGDFARRQTPKLSNSEFSSIPPFSSLLLAVNSITNLQR